MALTLNIGSGAIALVQNGTIAFTGLSPGGGPVPISMPAPSTAGTALIAVLGSGDGVSPVVASFSAGWVLLKQRFSGTASLLQIWGYLNNPGGISLATAQTTGTGFPVWWTHMSEWSNVIAAGGLEASGNASATSGTTLAPTTTGNVLSTGDLAISAWIQTVAVAAAVTFTTPASFTRLSDSGAQTKTAHLDMEYEINPATGAPLGPTLTSTGTTTSAAGAIICLKAAPPVVDQTAFLSQAATATLKLNTFDFALEDPATVPSLGDPVALTTPTWNGRVVVVERSDIVDIASGHKRVTITATNQTVPGGGAAPWDLSDVPNGTTLRGYQGLSVRTSQNTDGTVVTYGSCSIFDTGLAAGQTFNLTSGNLGYSAQAFVITNVTTRWQGLQSPVYSLAFGDPYPTLATAGGGILTKPGASTQAGINMPAGTLGKAQVTAAQGAFSAATDLTGLTVTVIVGSGRLIEVKCSVLFTGSVVGDAFQLTIQEGATVLQIGKWLTPTGGVNQVPLRLSAILTPTAGNHTYKLTAQRNGGTGTADTQAATTAPAYILVKDIGT